MRKTTMLHYTAFIPKDSREADHSQDRFPVCYEILRHDRSIRCAIRRFLGCTIPLCWRRSHEYDSFAPSDLHTLLIPEFILARFSSILGVCCINIIRISSHSIYWIYNSFNMHILYQCAVQIHLCNTLLGSSEPPRESPTILPYSSRFRTPSVPNRLRTFCNSAAHHVSSVPLRLCQFQLWRDLRTDLSVFVSDHELRVQYAD